MTHWGCSELLLWAPAWSSLSEGHTGIKQEGSSGALQVPELVLPQGWCPRSDLFLSVKLLIIVSGGAASLPLLPWPGFCSQNSKPFPGGTRRHPEMGVRVLLQGAFSWALRGQDSTGQIHICSFLLTTGASLWPRRLWDLRPLPQQLPSRPRSGHRARGWVGMEGEHCLAGHVTWNITSIGEVIGAIFVVKSNKDNHHYHLLLLILFFLLSPAHIYLLITSAVWMGQQEGNLLPVFCHLDTPLIVPQRPSQSTSDHSGQQGAQPCSCYTCLCCSGECPHCWAWVF